MLTSRKCRVLFALEKNEVKNNDEDYRIPDGNSSNQKIAIARFANAKDFGHDLADCLYLPSCVCIVFTMSHVDASGFDQEVSLISTAISPGSPYGITALVALRSITSSINHSTPGRNVLQPCFKQSHGVCGISTGYHIAALQIGQAYKAVLEECDQIVSDFL